MPPTPAKTALITGITGQDGSYLAEGLASTVALFREELAQQLVRL